MSQTTSRAPAEAARDATGVAGASPSDNTPTLPPLAAADIRRHLIQVSVAAGVVSGALKIVLQADQAAMTPVRLRLWADRLARAAVRLAAVADRIEADRLVPSDDGGHHI